MTARASIVVVIALLLGVAPVAALRDHGVLIGTVMDNTRAALPGAVIVAREIQTNNTIRAVSNGNGVYFLGPLKVGIYDLEVRAAGFKKAIRPAVEVHPNDRVGLDFVLEVGTVLEVIEVTGNRPLMNTETSSLEHVVERQDIEHLPLVDRNYQILAQLTAGVLPEIGGRDRGPLQRGGSLSSGFTSHGQPALQNNYLIDGVDNNSTVMGLQDRKAQVVVPSLEAVQEFKVQTSNYSAEFGRNAGAVVNVAIKSGTNQLHGSLYEFLRNDVFDARPAFGYKDRDGDGRADPDVLRQNMFGATLGGPLLRDRTFAFGSWEAWRVRHAQNDRSVVPTARERAGDFSATTGLNELRDPLGGVFPGKLLPVSRVDPVILRLLDLYPKPNYADPGGRENYLSSPPWHVNRDQFDFRLDHRLSERDTLFGRYSFYDFESLRAGSLPGLARGGHGNDRTLDDNRGRHLTVSETHLFSQSVVNEFRFGYKSLRLDRRSDVDVPLSEANARFGIRGVPPPGEGEIYGLSRILFTGGLGYRGLGGALFQPNGKHISTLQFLENVTWHEGSHSVKAGADLRYDNSDINGSQWSRGELRFNGRFTGIGLGDGLLGWADSARLSNLVLGEMRFHSWMFYLQDDWKVTPNFTLNLGLRWELVTPWYERSNRMNTAVIDPGAPDFGRIIRAGDSGGSYEDRALVRFDKRNLAPRIGFAWKISNKWTIRSGAGIFYGGQMGLGASSRAITNFPFTSSVERRATNYAPALILSDGFAADFLGFSRPAVETVADLPEDATFRVWNRDFHRPRTHQWNLNLQRELTADVVLAIAYVGSATQNISYDYDYNSAGIGSAKTEKQRRLFPRISSLSFRSPLAHSSYHGLDVNLQKRLRNGLGFSVAYTWGHNIGQRPDQFVDGDNGAPQDTRCFSCEKGNSSSDVRHRLAATYSLELPFGAGKRFLTRGFAAAVAGGWLLTGYLSAQTGMYFSPYLANSARYLGTGGVGIWRPDVAGDWRIPDPGPEQWFNTNAFVRPCDSSGNCRFGNLGRNTLQEPGMISWAAALAKRFNLRERLRLDFRWELLNAANHPNYGTPNRNLDSPDSGTIRTTRGQPRQMQLGLRLSF